MAKREFMPVLVPYAQAGALRAVGKVTGTHYIIKRQGTWVWAEDLPGLLAEKRPVSEMTTEPITCFSEARPSSTNAVPYKPWLGTIIEPVPTKAALEAITQQAAFEDEETDKEGWATGIVEGKAAAVTPSKRRKSKPSEKKEV